MTPYIYVAAGGALGAVARYAAGNLQLVSGSPHFNTLLVNVAGSLLIGIAWAVIDTCGLNRAWHQFLIAGVLGGFTTFSSFSLDSVRLLADGRAGESILYVAVTVVACLAACAAGLYSTTRLIRIL